MENKYVRGSRGMMIEESIVMLCYPHFFINSFYKKNSLCIMYVCLFPYPFIMYVWLISFILPFFILNTSRSVLGLGAGIMVKVFL